INDKIVQLAERLGKPYVATGDVHFLDPEDEVYRRVIMGAQGFSDADDQAPLYLKTTEEMLDEFSYLGEQRAYNAVVKYPNQIADEIENVIPVPEETYPPIIEGSEDQIRDMTMKKAHSIYGDVLPEVVEKRLDKELNSIIKHGFSVMYLIAQKLVTKSLQDGYLVGSRGSVGSSFVATMCDITEVNPLPPHYICTNCKQSEFFMDGSILSGADLTDKDCPNCGSKYKKDGHDIPFETFLGFDGDKEPDIDLNFAGEYQPEAHKYTEELFGKGYVFRAGTIGTVAEKTAYGFVKKYNDERNKSVHSAEITRLVKGCSGIKRTTGQHPGGVMIVPSYTDIYEFTPIQKPADDTDSNIITTHFDYHSISGRLLKLDILGHDVPTIIKMLEDITGFKATDVLLDDKSTMSLFTSSEALGVKLDDIDCKSGSLGIPEFGTKFVRQMLLDTMPTTFAELARISGLSHGTDVWLNNAQEMVRNGTCVLKEVISTRDDIMVYLIYKGVLPKMSFKIMENVRKGKGLTAEHEEAMREKNVPEWYIDSCKKIKYMFPKAHAVAYVMMSFRIAYYKVHYPAAFYATFYTVKVEDFDADLFVKGKEAVLARWREIDKLGNNASTKEKNMATLLEVVYEMYLRGIKLLHVDLYKSAADKFIVTEEGILPPLNALQGVGINAAYSIAKAREEEPFFSIDELREKTKVSKTVIEILKIHGCLKDIPESSQISLF
ncbi:MAG TPA: PolC-type DNA polymerase III, partial [Patescibacteria group bacterium]|nr:PolC-type DNA polymerase III [Patescibacteria group bacterium]